MSIHNRFLSYALRVMRGDIRGSQLLNLARKQLIPKARIVSWQPTHISISSTDRCNFRCDMCPTNSTKVPKSYVHRHREAPDMSLDLFRFVLDRYPNAIRVFLIGTGEPLLSHNFFDMVRECVKRRMIVNTYSNGYALNGHIHDIVCSGLERLCVSVNGHTEKEFHRMTGNSEAYYSRILRNVEELVRARNKKNSMLEIELSFIVDSYNYRHMEKMIEVGENLGVDIVSLTQFLPLPYPGFTPEERCLYADDPDVKKELSRLISKKYRCDVIFPYLLRNFTDKRTVCRWPFSMLRVDGGGNIGGCGVALLNTHGNGKVYDKDPWNNQYFRDLRRRHLQGDLFWPCKFCIESVGVKPSQVVKNNSSF